jgi:acetate CoA/acetoacetate CoA-transferase beta subunit
MDKREFITRRVAREFRDGDVVNLGIGMPTLVGNYIPGTVSVILQSENGMLGLGPRAEGEKVNENMTDAGGGHVTVLKGGSFFDSAFSFSIIRGGHVDATVLGALEVDQEGNLASWMVPGKKVTGMGGAMDLVVGAKRVIISMEHLNKNGEPKILKKCRLPLTAVREVDLIVTDMAVISVNPVKGFEVLEIAPGLDISDLINATEADLVFSKDLKQMNV